jgi:hypothetical protein
MRSLASFTIAFLVACSSSPKPAPAEPPAGSGSGSSAAACPAPRATTDICAQVITYAKTADGTCCQYPSPCATPIEGAQFSDDKCATPMGAAQ